MAGVEAQMAELLRLARVSISNGNPTESLGYVLAAVRLQGGEAAVWRTLNEAKAAYAADAEGRGDAALLQTLLAELSLGGTSHGAEEKKARAGDDRFMDDASRGARAPQPPTGLRGQPAAAAAAAARPGPAQPQAAFIGAENDLRRRVEPTDSSFLEEMGKLSIARDALADGSSVICPACHGIIARSRLEAHRGSWCPAFHG
jgi:hypothetical protein